jgi:hypothetical protein
LFFIPPKRRHVLRLGLSLSISETFAADVALKPDERLDHADRYSKLSAQVEFITLFLGNDHSVWQYVAWSCYAELFLIPYLDLLHVERILWEDFRVLRLLTQGTPSSSSESQFPGSVIH